MRKVSLIAAVFFAVAWLAVAEEGAPPVPPQYTPMPAPNYVTPSIVPSPMPNSTPRPMRTQTMSTPTPDGGHITTVYTTPIPKAAPPPSVWQIHRADSDTLLLNTATGETWMLEKAGEHQYTWQPITRNEDDQPRLGEPGGEIPSGRRPAVPPSQEFQTR